ncbi:MAG: hypothetical protein V4625_04655 [Pseudomonadota bacterium]
MAKPPKFQDTQPDISHAGETSRTGKGMPTRTPQAGREQVDFEHTQHDVSDEASLSLPHERDQSTDMTSDKPDPAIAQAKRDVDSGKQDTSRATETNRAYQKQK